MILSPVNSNGSDNSQFCGVTAATLTIGGTSPVSCVIDFGADVSVVSEGFIQQRPSSIRSGKKLSGATGKPLQAIGEVSLCVELGSHGLQHQFSVVKDFPYPVLLGTDFLSRVNAIVHLKSGLVTLSEG